MHGKNHIKFKAQQYVITKMLQRLLWRYVFSAVKLCCPVDIH